PRRILRQPFVRHIFVLFSVLYEQLGDAKKAVSIYHKVMDEAKGGDAFWGEMAETRTKELEDALKE
ncbi:MAG TPA: hypothetical protein VI955_02260, partial [Candidatus Omnitrophota bacterium]|nr:hypothetical protein [Candidatus Omnitrophota bacterium]